MTSKGAHLMNQSDDLEYQLDTLAIRTGHTRSFEGEHGEPILTSSFVYENAAEAAAKFFWSSSRKYLFSFYQSDCINV